MAKCVRCGMSGFNLKVDERGLCEDCAEIDRLDAKIAALNEKIGDGGGAAQEVVYTAPVNQPVRQQSGGELAVKVLLVLSCIVCGFALIPLLWMIPITVIYFKHVKNNDPIGIGFKIVVLLFVNLIAGIILLCMNTD